MIRKLLQLGIIIAIAIGAHTGYTYLIQPDAPHFRKSDSQPFFWRRIKGIFRGYTSFDDKGMEKLKDMASGYIDLDQFNELSNQYRIGAVFNGIPNDVYYIQNKPLKFYCIEKTGDTLSLMNKSGFKGFVCKLRRYVKGAALPSHPKLTSESEFLQSKAIKLINPMPENWLDDWSFVGDMINYFEAKQDDEYYYYHCGHGQGRTTTLMAMHDIFVNAKHVKLTDIFARHYLIGGEDLKDIEEWQDGTWNKQELLSRRNLLVAFYLFIKSDDGYKNKGWTEWLNSSHITSNKDDLWIEYNIEEQQ